MRRALWILAVITAVSFGFEITAMAAESTAAAASWGDPGGIITKIAGKIKGLGIGLALLGFLASWAISALSMGDDSIIAKGKKGATVAVVSGLILAVGVQIYQWFLS